MFLSGCVFFLSCNQEAPDTEEGNVASHTNGWPFDQAENVAAITTKQVIDDGEPILMVIHYSDDDSWAFLCNTTGKEEDGRVIGMGTALKLDPTLKTIADLPPGWIAERAAVGSAWRKHADDAY